MLKKNDILWWYKNTLDNYAELHYEVETGSTYMKFLCDKYNGQLEAYAKVLGIDREQLKTDKNKAVEVYLLNEGKAAI